MTNLWNKIQAQETDLSDPFCSVFYQKYILKSASVSDVLSKILSEKLCDKTIGDARLFELLE